MSKFQDKYKQPDLEKIELEDASFYVQLPTSANKRYERAVAAGMARRDPDSGEFSVIDFDMADVFDVQHRAFLKSCVIRVEGAGFDFDADDFYRDYPDAVEELFNIATEKASIKEREAAETTGKSQDSSSGQESGRGEKSSTAHSLKEAV